MRSCVECDYFDEDEVVGVERISGSCRRNAPLPLVAGVSEGSVLWPKVYGDFWCGEWEKK